MSHPDRIATMIFYFEIMTSFRKFCPEWNLDTPIVSEILSYER